MRAYDLIRKKRDGGSLSAEELQYLVWGATSGGVADEQLAAFLMAVFFRGMDAQELPAWLNAMLHSGRVLDLSAIPGRKVDKHSTGGVGDKISLAAGAAGRGLRRPRADGLRPRARPHRRHARQAREHPRLLGRSLDRPLRRAGRRGSACA